MEEAAVLLKAGFHGVVIENMHDAPYLLNHVGPGMAFIKELALYLLFYLELIS